MITSQLTTKAGEIILSIHDGGTATTVEITNIGNINYEYDIIPSSPKVESVKAFYAKCDVEMFQFTPSKEDVYARLRNALLSAPNNSIKVVISVDSQDFQFFVSLQDISVSERDRLVTLELRPLLDRTITVLDVFDQISAGAFRTFRHTQSVSEELDCCGVADWISQAMKSVFLNTYDSLVLSEPTNLGVPYDTNNYTFFNGRTLSNEVVLTMVKMPDTIFSKLVELPEDEQFNQGTVFSDGSGTLLGSGFENLPLRWSIKLINTLGQTVFAVIEEITSDTEIQVDPPPSAGIYAYSLFAERQTTEPYSALGALQSLAGIEGAVFGQAFSTNFYMNRVQQNMIVSVDFEKDIVDMESEIFYNPLGGGFVEQVATTLVDLESKDLNEGARTYGIFPSESGQWKVPRIVSTRSSIEEVVGNDSRLNLRLAPAYPFLSKAKAVSSSLLVGDYSDWEFDFDPIFSLCRSGLTSYQRSLSSDGSEDVVEFTIFGIDKVKAWNLVQFVNTPPLYNKYEGRVFRPTKIEYDIVQDLATIKAYELT